MDSNNHYSARGKVMPRIYPLNNREWWLYHLKACIRRKPLDAATTAEGGQETHNDLRRTHGLVDLTLMGIGATI
ncbi:hypothetical protein EV182_008654, partial [Spiromyces aspiralis]